MLYCIHSTNLNVLPFQQMAISTNGGRNCTVNILKFRTLFLFLFSNKILGIRAGLHKLFVGLANREDPYQTASFEEV